MVDRTPTGRSLWLKHVTKRSLNEAWEHIKDGGSAGRDGETPELFAQHLAESIRRLNKNLRHDSHHFVPYNQLLKSKGAGKNPRIISIPSVVDRVALRAMASFLRAASPDQVSTRLPQDLVAEVIAELETGRWTSFVKLDIKNFYPSISHDFLAAVLKKTLRNDRVVDVFMEAVRTPTVPRGAPRPKEREARGVPQGLAISNGLAELTLEHLDRFLASSKDFHALRFVDDIIVLTHAQHSEPIEAEIRNLAKYAGLEVHDDSSGTAKSSRGLVLDGFDFLGYQFDWPRVTVRSGSVAKIEARLARSFTAYKYALKRSPDSEVWAERCKLRLEWHLNLVITGFTLEKRRIGWLAYFSQIRNQQLLQHLDAITQAKSIRFGVRDLHLKSFVRTYRIVSSKRVDKSGYVPNFDVISDAEMRHVLTGIFSVSNVERLTEEEVRARFLRKIKKLSRELEADVPNYR